MRSKKIKFAGAVCAGIVSFYSYALFADTIIWTGADETNPNDWHTAANWSPATIPSENDDAMITNAPNVVISDNATFAVNNLTLSNSTVVLSKSGISSVYTIAGNLVLKDGSVIKNKVCTSTKYAVNLLVNGLSGISIDSTSKITSTACGNPIKMGDAFSASGYVGSAYGGRGGNVYQSKYGKYTTKKCYGSIREPFSLGSGPQWDSAGNSGGIVKLIVPNGNIEINGEVSSCGEQKMGTGSASGGSVWISAKAVIGTGVIDARGGQYKSYNTAGGAGRIAVYQTAAEQTNDSLTYNCSSIRTSSGSGSIYIENAKDCGVGEFIVDAMGTETRAEYGGVDLTPYLGCRIDSTVTGIDAPFKKITVKNRARFIVAPNVAVYTHKIDTATAASIRANIYKGNGPSDSARELVTEQYNTETCSASGGDSFGDVYILQNYGFSIIIR